MTEEKTDVQSGRTDAPAEPRNEPTTSTITDAERAANPFGAARREREQAERHRDDAGKFAKKDDAKDKPGDGKTKPDTKAAGDKPDGDGKGDDQQQRDGTVPHQALAEERRKRQALERQLADALQQRPSAPTAAPPQQQPQPEAPPAWWEDPDKAMEHRMRGALDPVSQQLQQQRIYVSRQFAVSQHGEEGVTAAVSALDQHIRTNPGDHARIEQQLSSSMDPIGDVVRWHKQQTTMQKFGADPEAYIKAEIERRIAEMQNGGERHDPPPAPRQPQQPLPASFAALPSGGPRGGGYGGPKALSEMLPRG